ncbi:hypothetical protein N9427_04235 [Paracoccaceae bacterium]|nr:hypothetical protein [Paracoccaceae bacterium]
MIDISKHLCGNLFDINPQTDPELPYLNMMINRKARFENDSGYGLYFFRFNNELLYIGSYCGSSGVAKDRWWTHLAGISCRFRETNFTNLSKKEPKLGTLLVNQDISEIDRLLEKYKTKFNNTYLPIADNLNFQHDVVANLMSVTSHASIKVLRHLLGDGSCSTFENRVKVANDRWDTFRELSAEDIACQFSFQYIKISEQAKYDPLVQFLYSNSTEPSSKKKLIQKFIEDRLIKSLLPPANKVKEPISGNEFDDAVVASSLQLIEHCKELALY